MEKHSDLRILLHILDKMKRHEKSEQNSKQAKNTTVKKISEYQVMNRQTNQRDRRNYNLFKKENLM